MDTTDATNPEPFEETEVATEDEAPETETDELDAETEDSEQEQPAAEDDEEYEEEERDGKKYKLPKWVQAERMMHGDYTQKTQRLAEERKAVEARAEAVQREQEINTHLGKEIHALDQVDERLEYLRTVDPRSLPPPVLAQYTAEKAHLENVYSDLSSRIEEGREALQKQQAETSQSVMQRIWRDVQTPNPKTFWDGKLDDKRRSDLTQFALDVGFRMDEVENTNHPVQIQVLNLAKIGLETLRKQSATLKKPPPAPVQPVKEIAGRRAAPSTVPSDKDDIKTWLEKRNKQLARKG